MLGSGAGRLAYDLHAAAAAVVDGRRSTSIRCCWPSRAACTRVRRIDLYEFPVAPRDLASHALLRTLTAPARAAAGLHLVLADAKQPPFGRGTFDTVLTPWLVDVVDTDLPHLAATVNALLAPGGRWICTGTLFFQQADPALRFSSEEVRRDRQRRGFRAAGAGGSRQPYLASPASRHARIEEVVTFAVSKRARRRTAGAGAIALARRWAPPGAAGSGGGGSRAGAAGARVCRLAGRRPALDRATSPRGWCRSACCRRTEATGIVRDYLLRLHEEAELRPPS